MRPKVIETAAEHDAALREIERLWNAAEGSAEGDRLKVLVDLVEAYEDTHFPSSTIAPLAPSC